MIINHHAFFKNWLKENIGKSDKKLPTCICAFVPAVILEIVQQASFLMLFLGLVVRRFSK